jgi:hypothetical protein
MLFTCFSHLPSTFLPVSYTGDDNLEVSAFDCSVGELGFLLLPNPKKLMEGDVFVTKRCVEVPGVYCCFFLKCPQQIMHGWDFTTQPAVGWIGKCHHFEHITTFFLFEWGYVGLHVHAYTTCAFFFS